MNSFTPTTDIEQEIAIAEKKLMADKKSLNELRKKLPKVKVNDYTFKTKEGIDIKLSEMFENRRELMLIHNMGKSCAYCTLWADELNGIVHHLENRVPFVLISPNDHETMKAFANGRNWKFKIYSSAGNTFKKAVGFARENGSVLPGVSIFTKDTEGNMYHTNNAVFGPGDNFCGLWSFLDLLPGGAEKWGPKFSY